VLRRAELEALDAAAAPVAPALSARRLRSDGLVCRSGGGGIGPLDANHRLLFASPAVDLPEPLGVPVAAVVVDDTDDPDGEVTRVAAEWAGHWGAPVVAFTHLAAVPPDGWLRFALDWPYLAAGPLPDRLCPRASAVCGEVDALVVDDLRMAPLARARATLARLGRRVDPWPAPLASASRFARILIDLAVSPDLYDAHVPGTIARPLTRRRDDLEETPSSALTGPWRDVAETDWAPLRADLLTAYDALVKVNHKANALGLTIEALLGDGAQVDVICSTRVAAAATRSWLLEGGFAGTGHAFSCGRLAVRAANETGPWAQERATVLPGIPARRHIGRLLDGDVGRLTVCCYPNEAQRLAVGLQTLITDGAALLAADRAETLCALMGAPDELPGVALEVQVALTRSEFAADLEAGDPFDFDAAEAAALAPDELADDTGEDDGDQSDGTGEFRGARWVPARAIVVESAGGGAAAAVLIAGGARLDRVAGGRVLPVTAGSVAPGMLLVGIVGSDRRELFDRLRPHLDTLHGPGTQVWLDVWRAALRRALDTCGGAAGLGDRLRAEGAPVRDPAVSQWPTPYRIGPRDPKNIARVASIARVPPLAAAAGKVGRIMEAVRARHRLIGMRVAAAVRDAAAGRPDAFDRLEAQLGVDVAEHLGDLTPWRVLAVSDAGWARRADLWRLLTPAQGDAAFCRDPPETVTPPCDTGQTEDRDATNNCATDSSRPEELAGGEERR
jgi:hypothetical protein